MDPNIYIKVMIEKMNTKFEKYWGECNLLISIVVALDPHYKMKLIEFFLSIDLCNNRNDI